VEQAAEQDRRGGSLLAAVKTLSFQLSGAQLGITITSLIVGFIAEPTIGRALEPLLPAGSSPAISVALALAIATVVEMIIAELIPKNYAIARPFETGMALAMPLRVFNSLFRPLIVFLNSAANFTVRLFRIEPREELIGVRSLEEIGLLVRASFERGALGEEQASLLARSISFGEKTAADALVPRTSIVAVTEQSTLEDLAEIARTSGLSRFPVYRRDLDDVVGIVHVKDSYRIPIEDRGSTRVSEIMQEALFVPESRDLRSLLIEMRRQRRQMAVVLDEYGGTSGVVALEDLLEEIVGEIEDEYDRADAATMTAPPEGIFVVSGRLRPDELTEQTGFTLPEGEFETLAGFLLNRFDRIPEVGDQMTQDNWELKVVEMDRKRIAKVLLVAPPPTVLDEERGDMA
jgi:CBS domain containing-hemolysin-like protein